MKHLRAALRASVSLAAAPLVAVLAAAQGFVIGPLFGNYTTIPNLFYKGMRRLFGYKVEFNAASAPLVRDRQVWFVANHMSIADFIPLGSALNGTFVGKGDILKWPVVSQIVRAGRFIGIRRSAEHNEESRAKIIKNFNAGNNTIMFPEGTTSDGKKVYLFRAGLITLLFGEKGRDKQQREVALEKEVVVQPIAIRVTDVDGMSATGKDDLRNLYSMYHEHNTLTRIWKRMCVRRMTIEITALPPLEPKNFRDAKELINKAALDIAGIVNPGQTTFEKAAIPR